MGAGTVLVVGSINVDLVVQVQRLPHAGETVAGGRFARHGGGKGANQAVAAARAGATVTLVGAVGDDDMAPLALGGLEAEGVDVSTVLVVGDAPTGVAAVVVDRQGENQIAVASGANGKLDGDAVGRALADVELAPDDTCLMNLEIPDEALVATARSAHAAGIRRIIVNPAPARRLPDALLELGALLTPNAGEATALAGVENPRDAAATLSRLTRAPVIVTCGAEGALLVEGDRQSRLAAPAVEAVDSTGAGDAFNGALAAALAQGFELGQAVRRAVAAATHSVRTSGARNGMARRDEIDALVDVRGSADETRAQR